MEKIKTLANCTDEDFLRQANKIRHALDRWLTITDISNIRKRLPKYEVIPEGTEPKEAEVINRRNEEAKQKQAKANIDAILDAVLEIHPKETLEIVRLCCFVEPDDDSHKITYYLKAFTEMFSNREVLDFFTSLITLEQKFGLKM